MRAVKRQSTLLTVRVTLWQARGQEEFQGRERCVVRSPARPKPQASSSQRAFAGHPPTPRGEAASARTVLPRALFPPFEARPPRTKKGRKRSSEPCNNRQDRQLLERVRTACTQQRGMRAVGGVADPGSARRYRRNFPNISLVTT